MPHGAGHVGGNSGGLTIPARTRQVQVAGQDVWLRRPDRADLGPVIDAQVEAEKDQNSDSRTILERGSQERIAAACVRVCVRGEKDSDKADPLLTEDDALALAVEASADERVPLLDSELVRTSMALCRAMPPKVSPEVLRAFLASRSPGN